jgi:hypothetical protein
MTNTSPPRYTGLKMSAGVGYSLAHPVEWVAADRPTDTSGVVLAPDPADQHTLFAIDVIDIPEPLDPADAETLLDELIAAIEALPSGEVLRREPLSAGLLRGADVRFDFDDAGHRRRRWVRILTERTRQLTVTAQGSSPERFDYWEPQLFTTMASVRVHHGDEQPNHDELRA